MINRDDIEAGDKVYTRDGGCLVAREVGNNLVLGDCGVNKWSLDCSYISILSGHPLDIIRIEKAPKPVVEYYWFGWDNDELFLSGKTFPTVGNYNHVIKLTIINSKLEKSEQVK